MHKRAKISCSLICDQFLPYMKGVWIIENYGEGEKFDVGLPSQPVLQVEGIELSSHGGLPVQGVHREQLVADVKQNFSSSFKHTFPYKSHIGRMFELVTCLLIGQESLGGNEAV